MQDPDRDHSVVRVADVCLADHTTHDVDTCGQCQYIGNASCIFVSKEQQRRATLTAGKILAMGWGFREQEDYIVELGRFTLPRWNGHAMWYLFQCPCCGEQCVDYLHRYRLYLKCSECDTRWQLSQDRFYREVGMQKPPSAWRQLLAVMQFNWRHRKQLRRAMEEGRLSLIPIPSRRQQEIDLESLKGEPPEEIKRQDESWTKKD